MSDCQEIVVEGGVDGKGAVGNLGKLQDCSVF